MLNKKISYDEKVSRLSLKSKLLFTWMIAHLDKKGRFFADPNIIKGQIIPFVNEISSKEIPKLLDEMSNHSLINLYEVSGHKYLEYIGFHKNQTINEDREGESMIPESTPDQLQSNSGVTQDQLTANINININKREYKREDTPTHPLQEWIVNNLSAVIKLDKQLTYEECQKLLSEFDETIIKTVLADMDNYKPLTKKYKSVYLTLRKWIGIHLRGKNGTNKKGNIDFDKYKREIRTEGDKNIS